jgi:hypothetical protein
MNRRIADPGSQSSSSISVVPQSRLHQNGFPSTSSAVPSTAPQVQPVPVSNITQPLQQTHQSHPTQVSIGSRNPANRNNSRLAPPLQVASVTQSVASSVAKAASISLQQQPQPSQVVPPSIQGSSQTATFTGSQATWTGNSTLTYTQSMQPPPQTDLRSPLPGYCEHKCLTRNRS